MTRALSDHERVIQAVLAKAFRREGHNLMPAAAATPLDALIALEEGEADDSYDIFQRFVDEFIGNFLFRDPTSGRHDPHPANVMKRLFFFVRAVRSPWILNMSGEEIAALFGQGRAAESARCNLLLGKLKKRAGYRTMAMPFQKSASSRPKYAQAARGNRHRANSVRAAQAA